MKRKSVERLVATAIMLGFATVLSNITPFSLPLGGSVTLCSMLPILIIAHKYGFKWGAVTSFCYILLMFATGELAKALSYSGGSTVIFIGELVFDYLIAFGALSLGSLFKSKKFGFPYACVVALIIRYFSHVLSGSVFFGVLMSKGFWEAFVYSLGYNGTFMLPETIITTLAAFILSAIPQMNKILKE